MKENHRFGINMKKYLAEHEKYLAERLEQDADPQGLLEYHDLKIRWLQHERLVHLIVTALTVPVFLISFLLLIYYPPHILSILFCAMMSLLLIAYIFHYFILENKVQYWYKLYDEIYQTLIKRG